MMEQVNGGEEETQAAAAEEGQAPDSLQDIHKYLATFNKEISTEAGFVPDYGAGDGGTVGFESGALAADRSVAPTLEAVASPDDEQLNRPLMTPDAPTLSAEELVGTDATGDGQVPTYSLQPGQEAAPPAAAASSDDPAEANTAFQTVTIIPSQVAQGGEISYVLIVSHPDGEDKGAVEAAAIGDGDMSIYDFKEELKVAKEEEDDDEEDDEQDADGMPLSQVRTITRRASAPGGSAGLVQAQLMCNYCNYTSTKRYLLTRHMKTHSEERPHHCHICERGFKTVASLQNHINTHTGVRPHRCKECDAAFTTSGELVRHVRYRHTYEKPHRCPTCTYASVELSKLKRHIRSHTGERPYQCPHCAYASPDTYKLKRHLRIHTGEKPYECDICHARFTQSNSLKAHKLIHTGDKPVFQCELCPTTCGRKTDLKIHVQKLHTSARPMQCRKCGKSFPDRYTYKIHAKTHEGEKCFRCELCAYAALSQRHLESHVLTHTGEKPFRCGECPLAFRQKQLLRRHRNLYHTPDYRAPQPRSKAHNCTVCGKRFAHRGNLLRHLCLHDPNNPEYRHLDDMGDTEEEEEEEDLDETMDDTMDETMDGSLQEATTQQVSMMLAQAGEAGDPGTQILLQVLPQLAAVQQQDGTTAVEQQNVIQVVQQMAAQGAGHQVEDSKAFPLLTTVIVQDGQEAEAGVAHAVMQTTPISRTVQRIHDHHHMEYVSPDSKRRLMMEDSPNNRRRKMEAAAALVQSQDARMMDEAKQKNIETCFGFDMD